MAKTKVMIVEDEIIIAVDLRNELQNLGYSICSFASSAEKAIKTAEQEKPDVVLMDIRLKGEMDGFEAAREIHSRYGIPTIFMTALPYEHIKEMTGITEPYEYIAKPFQADALQSAIESVLQKNKEDLGQEKNV